MFYIISGALGRVSLSSLIKQSLTMLLVSVGMFTQGMVYQNVSALLFVVSCIVLLVVFFRDEDIGIETFVFMPIVINLVFLILNIVFNNGDNYFANYDTLNNFYLKAELIVNKVSSGDFSIFPKRWSEKYLLFDLINSPIIYLKGRNEFIFVVLLSVYRSLTVIVIYKTSKYLFCERYARLACLLFIFNPLYIIHSSLIFKEAWIHLLFGCFYYCLVKLIELPSNKKCLYMLFTVSVICIWERLYLAVPVLLGLIPLILSLWRAGNKFFVSLSAMTLVGIVLYSAMLLSNVENFIDYLISVRHFYSTYSDVDISANYGNGYIFSIIKLFFSPYPNPRKLEIFTHLSCLIFWGSFWGAFINLSAIAGLMREKINKTIFQSTIIIILSYVAIVGFIAPYGFRQRDAISPVLVIWAAFGIIKCIEGETSKKIVERIKKLFHL